MTAIEREKLRVYDYVSDCYKHSAQAIVYMNAIHPLETHNSTHVDDGTGQVVEGEELDDEHNRHILPPINPRPSRRPRVKRIESQRQGVKLRGAPTAGKRVIIGTHVEILMQIFIQGTREM